MVSKSKSETVTGREVVSASNTTPVLTSSSYRGGRDGNSRPVASLKLFLNDRQLRSVTTPFMETLLRVSDVAPLPKSGGQKPLLIATSRIFTCPGPIFRSRRDNRP